MINFVEKRKWFYIIAVVCMVIIFGTAVVLGVPMDIQFKGGSMITYSYSGDLSVSEVPRSVCPMLIPLLLSPFIWQL